MLMEDDTGWFDFGCYNGGRALGHPTPHVDQLAKEGAMFTSWYGQASCTAGRASFMTGRIPIRSALSVVVAPGDQNSLARRRPPSPSSSKRTATQTYFSGKWHLGDKPTSYPIEHGFDEMKSFGAYYPGVYTYSDTIDLVPSVVPVVQPGLLEGCISDIVNMYEWEGVAGQPAKKVTVDHLGLSCRIRFRTRPSSRSTTSRQHAKDDKPFFMDVNFLKMHNPNNPAKKFAGKSHLGVTRIRCWSSMTTSAGSWMSFAPRRRIPSSSRQRTTARGRTPSPTPAPTRSAARKARAFEAGWRVPGIMWWPDHIPAGAKYDEMMSHIDCWATLASMVGVKPPPHGEWKDNNGKPIYFDSIDNSAYILGKAKHSARDSWIYIDGENFMGARADIGGDPNNADTHIAWKIPLYGEGHLAWPTAEPGLDRLALQPDDGSVREIRHDFQWSGVVAHADVFTGPAMPEMDNGWALSLIYTGDH